MCSRPIDAEDLELLKLPPEGPFTPPVLFVCTFVGKLGNLCLPVNVLTHMMEDNVRDCLVAVNSNYGHAAAPGYERYLKYPKPNKKKKRPRRVQGDGSCFNSAVEPVLRVEHPDICKDKVYFVKCFPTTGEIQIPGVVLPDLRDGGLVLRAFVAYLNALGAGCEDTEGRHQPVIILREKPKMMDYKFRLNTNSPRVLVNLRALYECLKRLEKSPAAEDAPPYPIRETRLEETKVSLRFRVESGDTARQPRVNVFQKGKINILGADRDVTAQTIYDFFYRLFRAEWHKFVALTPKRDSERAGKPRLAPGPALTDAEIEALLVDLYGLQDSTVDEVRRQDIE